MRLPKFLGVLRVRPLRHDTIFDRTGWRSTMREDVDALSDRERETLRLLARGHEAKSIASALGVSVHTVNERLRAARRKLGVSSSREAARLLLALEAGPETPENIGYKKIGVAGAGEGGAYPLTTRPRAAAGLSRVASIMIGAVMLVVLMSALIAIYSGDKSTAPANAAAPTSSIPSLFAVTDYPAEALQRRAQGIAGFRLQISGTGRVEKCDIQRSSGNAALDEATCRVIMKRSHFRPATNAAGHAVASVYTGTIHWRL